jgi:hypothetical protein
MISGAAVSRIQCKGLGEVIHATVNDHPSIFIFVFLSGSEGPHTVTRCRQRFERTVFCSFEAVVSLRGDMYFLSLRCLQDACACDEQAGESDTVHCHGFPYFSKLVHTLI